ncbi:MAG: alkaline phosphatase D family protein [Geodermatophilaceae bacterium]|nr:alkaline phosphatase D family protein [Geodermatophilaceae bacterium]
MTSAISRRSVLKTAALGTAIAVAPTRLFSAEAAAAPAFDGIFGYGVASGDPTATAVIIWTRATPPTEDDEPPAIPGSGAGGPLTVTWQVAREPQFRTLVSQGRTVARALTDHTVKIDVTGLTPYTQYYYRFQALGQVSPVGRTRTAPDVEGEVRALRLSLVSCSNFTGGYFTTYRAIARRDDLDFVLHVGDYIYEYGNGEDRYGPPTLIGRRDHVPADEIVDLADYRMRHALHKADPDSQLAHRLHPWITIFDDHEVTNNAWATDAENHTPGEEGNFFVRRAQAYRAYLEWMPFRLPEQKEVPHRGIRFFRRFTFGALGDLSVIETRQNRSAQIDVPPFSTKGGGFIPEGAPGLDDPDRHLPEPEQLAWLTDGLTEGDTPWHLVGNQTLFSPIRFPGDTLGVPGVTLLNSDQWDGYQADQASLIAELGAASAGAGDAVFLTGDIHSSWAIDVPADRAGYPGDGQSVAVEFVCPSVTSDGFYEVFTGGDPSSETVELGLATVAAAKIGVQAMNPWVRYLDGVGHGYTVIDVTPERVQADFYLTPTPTVAKPDPRIDGRVEPTYASSWQTLAGSRSVGPAAGQLGARSDDPA